MSVGHKFIKPYAQWQPGDEVYQNMHLPGGQFKFLVQEGYLVRSDEWSEAKVKRAMGKAAKPGEPAQPKPEVKKTATRKTLGRKKDEPSVEKVASSDEGVSE